MPIGDDGWLVLTESVAGTMLSTGEHIEVVAVGSGYKPRRNALVIVRAQGQDKSQFARYLGMTKGKLRLAAPNIGLGLFSHIEISAEVIALVTGWRGHPPTIPKGDS